MSVSKKWRVMRCNEVSKRIDSRVTWFNCKHALVTEILQKKKHRRMYKLESLVGFTYVQYVHIHRSRIIWIIDVFPLVGQQPRTISVFNYAVLRFDHSIWLKDVSAPHGQGVVILNISKDGRKWRNHLQPSRS